MQQIKNTIRNFYLEIQPYLSIDIIAGSTATLVILYTMMVALFSLEHV